VRSSPERRMGYVLAVLQYGIVFCTVLVDGLTATVAKAFAHSAVN
jgi:hypothetical protein